MHTHSLTYIQYRVITEWLIHMVCLHFLCISVGKVLLCSVRDVPLQTHGDMCWMHFCQAQFSCTLGGKKTLLIAVIHHSRGIGLIEKFKVPHQ